MQDSTDHREAKIVRAHTALNIRDPSTSRKAKSLLEGKREATANGDEYYDQGSERFLLKNQFLSRLGRVPLEASFSFVFLSLIFHFCLIFFF